MPKWKIVFVPPDGTKPRMVDDESEEVMHRRTTVIADSKKRRKERLLNRPTNVNWRRIEDFIGYGDLRAPLVFVGIEEGLANAAALDRELLLQDLLWRSAFKPVMDAEEAHAGLADGPNLFPKKPGQKPRRQPTWRVMADVMLRFNGETFKSNVDRAKARMEYRPLALGRSNADSLLIELLPYPNTKRSAWLYRERFPTREAYVETILPRRLELVSEALAECPREAIICYGRSDWPKFKRLFPAATKWKAIEGRYNNFECATWRGAKLTLSYHFSRYLNTDEELNELEAIALPDRQHGRGR